MSVDSTQKASLQKLMIISALIIATAALVLGFALGRYQVIKAIGATPAEIETLRQKASEHNNEVDTCMDRLNTAMLERDVALSSTEEMKKMVTLREQESADQQDLLRGYRQVISARGGLALNVQKIAINAMPERAYEYQIDLSQINNGRRVSGQIALKLIGGGMELVIPMPQTAFNFDYIQRLKGQWTMPNGFTPQYLDITITQGGTVTTQRYAWQVGAVVPNMPATLLEYQEANTLKSEISSNRTDNTPVSKPDNNATSKPDNSSASKPENNPASKTATADKENSSKKPEKENANKENIEKQVEKPAEKKPKPVNREVEKSKQNSTSEPKKPSTSDTVDGQAPATQTD